MTFWIDGAYVYSGANIYIVGSTADLGSWAQAYELDGTQYPDWTITINMPAGEHSTFRFLAADAQGDIQWEAGADRSLTVPNDGSTTATYEDSWR